LFKSDIVFHASFKLPEQQTASRISVDLRLYFGDPE
jgi:hypothetical protein